MTNRNWTFVWLFVWYNNVTVFPIGLNYWTWSLKNKFFLGFKKITEILEKTYRSIRFDRPGFWYFWKDRTLFGFLRLGFQNLTLKYDVSLWQKSNIDVMFDRRSLPTIWQDSNSPITPVGDWLIIEEILKIKILLLTGLFFILVQQVQNSNILRCVQNFLNRFKLHMWTSSW